MGFSCYCDDGPEFSSIKLRKAAKDHICCECGETIPKGARYEHYTGKWDGPIMVYKTCERCTDLRDSYAALGYCVTLGELWNDHRDMIADKNSKAYLKADEVCERRYQLYLQRRKQTQDVSP